ncbi:MAG: aspartate kinase [Flavobacteriales bacterium]|nr:aspartate kinase [Flavobacteriales bacterium]
MKVFKFGGASVKDADAVRNVGEIISNHSDGPLIVVVSAMGKTTNAFEKLHNEFFNGGDQCETYLKEIKDFHFKIIEDLFPDSSHPVYEEIHNTFVEVEWQIEDEPVGTFDFEYDQMVSLGEVLSTKIISAHLKDKKIDHQWMDVRDLIRTDNRYRQAQVDWEQTEKMTKRKLEPYFKKQPSGVVLTQGFIGGTSENFTSTLGREGSDYSAAILACAMGAEEVVIWKDVEGMYNADPKYFENTVKLNNISFQEAIELAYFGASVIHPKTVQPLHRKNIPLIVKSFINPDRKGSLINEDNTADKIVPSYIHKPNQRLISIASRDYAFIVEHQLSEIFQLFSEAGVSINLMQNSAISFSVCVDEQPALEDLIKKLSESYKVTYNKNLTLITIRHYTEEIIEKLIGKKKVYLEQRSRNTGRFVVGSA